MRIGVVYGVHGGDERIALDIGSDLEQDPIDPANVQVIVANERAVAENCRFIDENMALSFNNADPYSSIYERRRAAEVLGWCVAGEFDLILDIHGSRYDASVYGGIGLDTTNDTIRTAQLLGYENLVVGTLGLPNIFNNALTVEEPYVPVRDSPGVVKYWRQKIRELLEYDSLEDLREDFTADKAAKIWAYQNAIFVDGDAAEQFLEKYGDGAFEALSLDDARAMGIGKTSWGQPNTPYTINVGSSYQRYGIIGEYVFYVGETIPTDVWRKRAGLLVPSDHNWATPELVAELV